MDGFTIIFIAVWIFGAYKGWGWIGEKNWEWVNRQEPLNYVVKGAACVLLGFVFFVVQMAKLAGAIMRIVIR